MILHFTPLILKNSFVSGGGRAIPKKVLSLENLKKRYGQGEDSVRAVKGISFCADRGEIVGLLGPNGAGKKTTIKCISSLIREARWGTLEQLYMSPEGFGWISFFQVLSSFSFFFLANVGFLYLMMVTIGRFLHLRLASTLPILVLTLSGVAGIGYFLGGLTLVFKRVESFLQIVQFAFLALVMFPLESFPLMKYFPLAYGADLLREVMIHGKTLSQFPPGDLVFLALNSGIYFAIGFGAFKYFESVAKRKGLLGHY